MTARGSGRGSTDFDAYNFIFVEIIRLDAALPGGGETLRHCTVPERDAARESTARSPERERARSGGG